MLLPDFALDCGYMSQDNRDRLTAGYEEVGKMLSGMIAHPEKFAPACGSSFLLSAFRLVPSAFCPTASRSYPQLDIPRSSTPPIHQAKPPRYRFLWF